MTVAVTPFADRWAHTVAERSVESFLVYEGSDGRVSEWTYAEFDHQVSRVAATLHRLGVQPGDSVHLALTNSPTFVAVWLATVRLGAWIVPSDPMAKTPELEGHITRTRPRVGVCSSRRADAYRAVGADLAVIEVDEDDVDLTPFDEATFGDWPEVDTHDRAAVMFTSGTTGLPKGVEITQANYGFAGQVMADAAGLRAGDRQLVVLPLFHANAQYYSFASAIHVGASVALIHTFSASGFLGQTLSHAATHASLFAAPIRMILARGAETVDGLRLRHCWFAQNLTDDQYHEFAALIGCRPRQLYGMTETIPAVLSDEAADPVPSSMGFVTAGCQVDVQDADGRSVDVDEVGEIVVGGEPGVGLFAGYLDAPEVTADSFRDGWFRTGDRARRDADGRHFFDGRRSDVLKVAGENVSIVEVEAVLADHPKVLEAAVVGRADPVRDEVPIGFVVAADLADPPTVEELMVWCGERLGKAKQPREVMMLDELPRTSVGKIRKFLLQNPGAET